MMLLKLRILLVGVLIWSIYFGGVFGRYLEDDSHRFQDPFQMGPVSEFRPYSKLLNAFEQAKEFSKETPEYDLIPKNDMVYPYQLEESPLENLPKPVPLMINPAIERNSHKEDLRKKNIRKACKYHNL